MKTWQLQEAKAHLSQVVQQALSDGPQEISLRGEPAVVVISVSQFDALTRPKPSFVCFMRESPFVEGDLKLQRDKSLTRKIEL